MVGGILKPWQERALEYIFSRREASVFYLTGGTALAAYYLHHRVSDDLDLFSYEDFKTIDIEPIAEGLKEVLGAETVHFSRLYDRRLFLYRIDNDEAKIEFTRYEFQPLKPVNEFHGIRVDSQYDIAVNKLITTVDRFDPKDFVDLYFLLQRYPLHEVRKGVQEKFGMKLDPIFLGGELLNVKRIAALPKMRVWLTVQELKDFFTEQAKTLRPEVLEE